MTPIRIKQTLKDAIVDLRFGDVAQCYRAQLATVFLQVLR